MPDYLVKLRIDGKPVEIRLEAETPADVRPQLMASMAGQQRTYYDTAAGRRLTVEWRNVATLEVEAVEPA